MSTGQAPPVSTAVRVTTVAAVVVVAVVAAVVSFSHMQEVATRAGEQWRSWLIPASVDGLIVAASMVLLVRRRAGLPGGWLAWAALLGGVVASLACNIAAAQPTVTARLIAAWPPLAFAGAFELLLQQRRSAAPGGSARVVDDKPPRSNTPADIPASAPPGPPVPTGKFPRWSPPPRRSVQRPLRSLRSPGWATTPPALHPPLAQWSTTRRPGRPSRLLTGRRRALRMTRWPTGWRHWSMPLRLVVRLGGARSPGSWTSPSTGRGSCWPRSATTTARPRREGTDERAQA